MNELMGSLLFVSISIQKCMKEGTIVGNVAKDLGLDKTSLADRLLRVVSDSKDAFFEVNPDNGVLLAIYDVTIVAKDAGTPSLTSVKSITIIVSDVNDNRPEFSANPYTFYVTENNLPGVSLFSVRASDHDEGENSHISYHILRDEKENSKLSSYSLNINSDNGEILALKSFDFESLKTFQFQVVASDSGTPPLSNNVTVNVFILDQNDNWIYFLLLWRQKSKHVANDGSVWIFTFTSQYETKATGIMATAITTHQRFYCAFIFHNRFGTAEVLYIRRANRREFCWEYR
uniref:Cadherin domain-containing protein n=1 Tax=Oreochromis aureus TaxID=47969 RepID=A0AAZ1WX19_OREAU